MGSSTRRALSTVMADRVISPDTDAPWGWRRGYIRKGES